MEELELSPELKAVEDSIKTNNNPQVDAFKPGYVPASVVYDEGYFFKAPIAQPLKPSFESRNYNIDDAYAKLSDNTYVAKYDTYKVGRDNNEYFAQQQSTSEKWLNGIQKFGAKTANAVLGGTVGVAYGLGSAVEQGSFDALYNNNFSNWLSDLDTKLNYQLPNYYTQQEQEKGLGGQLLTANFWSDKVLGGLSFTAGAIVSEGIWAYATGGASLARRFAMWGTEGLGMTRVASGVSKMKGLVKQPLNNVLLSGVTNTSRAIALGRAGEALNTLRFTMTSAGYEASVEALQYRKEQEELFNNNFENEFGRLPSQEEKQEFYQNLESSANAVFGANMALVGSSNLITLGNIFKIKSPINTGVGKSFDKALYGIGKTTPSRLQRLNRTVLPFVKNSITEGLYEEGGQSISSNVAGKWLEHSYNPNLAKDSFDTMGSFYESLSEQYGTKEGWVENGVGMIIGLLGEAGTGNTRNQVRRTSQIESQREKLTESYTQKAISDRFLMANRINGFNRDAELAESKGNITEARIAQDGVLYSMLTNRYLLGDSINDISSDVEASVNSVSQDQLQALNINENIDDWKTAQISSFNDVAKSFKRHREFAEYVIGRNPIAGIQELSEVNQLSPLNNGNIDNQESLIQSLTYTLMGGERANSVMQDAISELSGSIGLENTKALEIINQLEPLSNTKKREIEVAISRSKTLEQRRDNLLQELQNVEQSTNPNVDTGNKILKISDRIRKLNNQIESNNQLLQQYADEINTNKQVLDSSNGVDLSTISNFQAISVDDLISLDSNTQKLEQVLKTIRSANPQRSANLEAILEEYNKARNLFLQYQNTILAFNSGEVKVDSINTWLGKRLQNGQRLDDFTKEWMSGILSEYSGRASKTLDNLTKTQQPTNESIASKLLNSIPLNQEEQLFYDLNKEAIDTFIKREPMLPAVSVRPSQRLTKQEYLRQRLSDLLSKTNNSLEYIGTSVEDFMLEKPTQAEIEEYQNDPTREDLREKLSNWKVLGSFLNEENMSLTDMVELLNQVEQQIDQQETLSEISLEDAISMTSEDKEGSAKSVEYSIAQNTLGSATIFKEKGGFVTLHHISPISMLDEIGLPFTITRNGEIVDTIQPNDVLTVENGLTFTVLTGNIIRMKSDMIGLTPYLPLNSGLVGWSYSDLYYNNGSEYVKKPSDFTENISPEELYNAEKGQQVRFEIDRNDQYTNSLLERYTEDPSEENKKVLISGLKIYTTINGVRVSTVKSLRQDIVNPNISMLRMKGMEMLLQNSGEVDLSVTSLVSNIYLGSPQFYLDEQGRLEARPFNSTDKIVTTGYIQDGELSLANQVAKEVNRVYVGKLSAKNRGKKVPIIVVKKGINYVALPITLNDKSYDASRVLDEIISSGATFIEQAKLINNAIQVQGINAEKVIPQELTEDKIEELRQAFSQNKSTITADELAAPNYNKSNIALDAQSFVDTDNLDNVISDPKLTFDVEGMLFGQTRPLDRVSVENDLNDIALELYNDFIQNAQTKYTDSRGNIIENSYTDVFDETPIENSKSHINKLKNINTLRKAFEIDFNKNRVLRDAIGQDRIQKVKTLFKSLDNLSEQLKPTKSIAESGNKNTKC